MTKYGPKNASNDVTRKMFKKINVYQQHCILATKKCLLSHTIHAIIKQCISLVFSIHVPLTLRLLFQHECIMTLAVDAMIGELPS